MINYIGILALGLFIGLAAGILLMNYVALLAERDRERDIATGTPIASALAREMKIKLDNYEERELWA